MTGAPLRVAFLGLGRMGAEMAAHVARAGHDLTVWNRSPGKADALTALGARAATDVADAVSGADVVVVMLTDATADRDVLAQVSTAATPGTLVVDASTVGPDAARELAGTLAAHSIDYVDAPVAGSVAPAHDGTLGSFVGGSVADVDRARPVIELWASPAKIIHTGAVGTGSALKLVANLAIGVTAQGIGEALVLARALDLDPGVALDALAQGPFGIMIGQKEAMLRAGDYSTTAFSVDLVAKDLALALAKVPEPATVPATAAALASARAASAAGSGGDDLARISATVRDHA